MKIIKNKLSNIGKAKCDCENLDLRQKSRENW